MFLSFIFVCFLWFDLSEGFLLKDPAAATPSSISSRRRRKESSAFGRTSSISISTSTSSSLLFGINEWRDTDFGEVIDTNPLGGKNNGNDGGGTGIPREICLLPFPFTEVLLQGETKQLRLYEERFIKLFETVMDKHSGVVAMGLIAESGIIQT